MENTLHSQPTLGLHSQVQGQPHGAKHACAVLTRAFFFKEPVRSAMACRGAAIPYPSPLSPPDHLETRLCYGGVEDRIEQLFFLG